MQTAYAALEKAVQIDLNTQRFWQLKIFEYTDFFEKTFVTKHLNQKPADEAACILQKDLASNQPALKSASLVAKS